ncbi:uncharacterized protein LOC142550735 [Primulina tabacum]|uniref:uncharacterized protein LOC142550735 n=1 Tax=Primulina tabacum TaxID=48773 RepID=UPI003F597318
MSHEIANCFVDFYKGLLGQKVERSTVNRDVILSGPCVMNSDWNVLTASVSIDEIRAALFDIDNDKASGSDGFGSFFFKHAWDLIKHEVIELLKLVIDKIMYGAQAAFIHGRFIVDNIHLVQELLRKYACKRGSPRCILKVHIQKAYDTVDWEFLDEVLSIMNFLQYSFALNGTYHGYFIGKRGLRQDAFGDMAGLRVNSLKSSIYMASIDDSIRHEILQLSGFVLGTFPFRYFCVPLKAIAAKISCWPMHSLSYAGKIELIKSIIQGVECFWLSILPPDLCCQHHKLANKASTDCMGWVVQAFGG